MNGRNLLVIRQCTTTTAKGDWVQGRNQFMFISNGFRGT